MAGSEKLGELLGGSGQPRGRRRVDILISTGHYRLEQIQLLATMTETLFIHMRSIRARTSGENDRVQRLITGYLNVIKTLEDVIPIWPNTYRVNTRQGWPRMWQDKDMTYLAQGQLNAVLR